jgi:hypothetical protein
MNENGAKCQKLSGSHSVRAQALVLVGDTTTSTVWFILNHFANFGTIMKVAS